MGPWQGVGVDGTNLNTVCVCAKKLRFITVSRNSSCISNTVQLYIYARPVRSEIMTEKIGGPCDPCPDRYSYRVETPLSLILASADFRF